MPVRGLIQMSKEELDQKVPSYNLFQRQKGLWALRDPCCLLSTSVFTAQTSAPLNEICIKRQSPQLSLSSQNYTQ